LADEVRTRLGFALSFRAQRNSWIDARGTHRRRERSENSQS
jgi:hypothetical protein